MKIMKEVVTQEDKQKKAFDIQIRCFIRKRKSGKSSAEYFGKAAGGRFYVV